MVFDNIFSTKLSCQKIKILNCNGYFRSNFNLLIYTSYFGFFTAANEWIMLNFLYKEDQITGYSCIGNIRKFGLKRVWDIRPKPNNWIKKNGMTEYFWPYYQKIENQMTEFSSSGWEVCSMWNVYIDRVRLKHHLLKIFQVIINITDNRHFALAYLLGITRTTLIWSAEREPFIYANLVILATAVTCY